MKKLIFTAALLFTMFGAFAQDTLIVPTGKIKYIKIGDKVYKVITTLEEVNPELHISSEVHDIFLPFIIPNSSTYITPAISFQDSFFEAGTRKEMQEMIHLKEQGLKQYQ